MTGLTLLKEHVAELNRPGMALEIWEHAGQPYVYVPAMPACTPPWDAAAHDILIAIPAAYDLAALDAFYLSLPYTFNGGIHPRVENGSIIEVNGRRWRLVSWHYPDGKPWQAGRDTLGTHIVHCKGFFLQRGAINDYR